MKKKIILISLLLLAFGCEVVPEEDPSEMKNVYDDPKYLEIRKNMHKRLIEMRNKYGDSDQLNQMHLERYLTARKR